jgi:hypothetical protein
MMQQASASEESEEAMATAPEEAADAIEEEGNESGYQHGQNEDDDNDQDNDYDYDNEDDDYSSDNGEEDHGADADAGAGAVLRGPCDASRMELSQQERQWALAVKQGIEGTPEIDNLSDFMYVQLALVHRENVEKALECAFALQHTRQEYSLLDSLEEGLLIHQKMLQLFPGMYLSFSYAHDEECYAVVFDISKFAPSVLNSVESIRTWIASCFYNAHAMTPDFGSARTGGMYIAECQGYHWKSNMCDLKMSEMYWSIFGSVYPLVIYKMKCFHIDPCYSMSYIP